MALGLNEVLSKHRNIAPRKSAELYEFNEAGLHKSASLRPWESGDYEESDNGNLSPQELYRDRAQHAVEKAREIVSKNNLMIDEIHRRRKSEPGMEMAIPDRGPRPLEILNQLHSQMSAQDPVLRLWKRSFWERFSDILH